MCYEKRPKYLGAFTPAYKTYIMYFIKLLKLLLLSSPCHRESSTDRKVSEKQSLSGATDATRSKANPARTQVTTWGCCHFSLWAAVPGDARLGPGAAPTPVTPIWVSTTWETHPYSSNKPLWLLLPGYHQKHHGANPALVVTRSQREDWGRKGALLFRKDAHNPCRKGRDTAGPWCAACSVLSAAGSTTRLLVPPHYFDLFRS